MVKFIKQRLDIDAIRLASVLALLYFTLFNSAVLIYKFTSYKATIFSSLFKLGKESIFVCIALFIIFLGLTIYRKLFIFSAIFLFLTGALASYALYMHGVIATEKILSEFYKSSFSGITGLLSIRLLVWLVFCSGVLFYSLKYFRPSKNESGFLMKLISAVCLLVTVNNIISPQLALLGDYFPLQYLHSNYMYLTNL